MVFWFQNLLDSLRDWWRRCRRRHRFEGLVRLDTGAEQGAAIRAQKLVLVGSEEKPKWLRFACPCRCGDVLALNLMASHSPRWNVEIHPDQTVTVNPSVDATKCGSHFWIRKSGIEWV